MNFRRIHWVLVIILIILGGAAAIWSELYSMWRSQYTLMYIGRNKQNLIQFQANKIGGQIARFFLKENGEGLPGVHLYVSQRAQANLMKNLPNNIKKWQPGYLVYPDGKLRKVKVRHRGDNPVNWAYAKKSWRVKTTKKKLIDRVRRFNYIVPQSEDYLTHLLDYEIHRRMGLPTPDARLIELFINEQSNGVYLELEQLDENFLRRRSIMPVNLYKGEQQNNERKLMIESNLFGNASLWSKQSNFNHLAEDDYSDLENFLRVLKDAKTSDKAFGRLVEIARFEDWARFAVFQTLVQSWHNDDIHNMRLVSDPWKGTIFPIVHDTTALFLGNDGQIVIDKGTNTLQKLYNQSSYFLLTKHQILKSLIDERLLLRLAEETAKTLPALKISDSRDVNHHVIGAGNRKRGPSDRLLVGMRSLHNAISKTFSAPPTAIWSQEEGILKLVVSGNTPVGKLVIKSGAGYTPSVFAWDADMNGRLSVGDMILPFKSEHGKFTLEAIWYANRLSEGRTQPTTFNIVSDVDWEVDYVDMINPFTGNMYKVQEGHKYGATPIRLNKPVIKKVDPTPLILEGNIFFKEARIFDRPVHIRAGTIIRMYPRASLIFQNRVTISGEPRKPVHIISAIPEQPWGVVAIYGSMASGSRVSNLNLEGGSGQVVKGVHYIAMLSVHDTSDVIFDGIILRRNKVFDDAMHIIYSKNIKLKNSQIQNAYSDGLDIDISRVDISRTTVTESGNDAVDLMSSRVTINQSRLIGSGDKGVSVGEASTVVVVNSLLKDNEIGLESKDGSDAYIINTDMLNNKTQINAYQKNWRYGQGGRVDVNKVFMRGERNVIKADKHSRIELNDNTVRPSALVEGGKVIVPQQQDNSSEFSNRKAETPIYTDKVKQILDEFRLLADPAVRGMHP